MKELKKVLRYLLLDKKNFILTTSLIIIETSFELIIPFLMKDIINEGVNKSDIKQILISGLLIIGCALISLVTGHLYSIFMGKLISNYSYNLREDIYEKIQEFSFVNLEHFDTTSLIARVTNDTQIMQNTLLGIIRPLFRAPIMLILGVLLSFLMAPQIAWIFMVAVPFLALIMIIIIHFTAPKYSEIQKDVDLLDLVVRENTVAIRTVKAYVKEKQEIEKFKKANEEVTSITTKTTKIAVLNTPFFQLSMYAVMTLLLAFGTILVHDSKLEVGSLSGLLSYVLQVLNSIMMLSNVFILLNKSFASSKRLNEILSEKPSMKEYGKNKVNVGDINLKNVFFKYKENSEEYVLSNINLNIPHGSSLGIIGATGSSKSTLVSLILRLYDASLGVILIDGVDVKKYDLKDLRNSISIVLQNNVLFTGTIRENLLWGNKNATEEEIKNALKISCADEFVYRLPNELEYDLGQGGENISGGQRQRLCIARALLKKPKIIIFDDSTSACDMETERKILQNIRNLKDVTNIIIGQRVNSVIDADNIIILENGKIVASGKHSELYESSSMYKELCNVQLGGK